MKTQDQLVDEFRAFANSLIEKLRPPDAKEITPGLDSYKESYALSFFENRKKLQVEIAEFVSHLLENVDPSINKMKLDDQLFEIGKTVYLEFTDKYWKSKQI